MDQLVVWAYGAEQDPPLIGMEWTPSISSAEKEQNCDY